MKFHSKTVLCAAAIAVVFPLLLNSCGDGGGVTVQRITANGGRVAWYKGAANHELIAFDAVYPENNPLQNTEVFIMNPDGTGITCVTCDDRTIPKGFIGQPEWHPDGAHLVIQAENTNSAHARYNHLSWGINQDLWIINIDGTGAEKIYDNSANLNHAALHPHFNPDGTKMIFSERIATNVVIPSLIGITPGGENPWAGWQIHLAAYNSAQTGTAKLTAHSILYGAIPPSSRGFFETHGFFGNSIVYSKTVGGAAYVDDIFSANLDGSGAVNLINSPTTWDEHGTYSPSGNAFVFISSRVDSSWQYPGSDASTLRTELFIKKNGSTQQLTFYNRNGDPDKRYLTSDFEWDRTGRRIVVQVAPVDAVSGNPFPPEIWMITFPEPL